MNKFLRFFLFLLPALFCMLCIFYFSSQTASQSSETSGSLIQEILIRVVPDFDDKSATEQESMIEAMQFFVRKGAHFSIYAVLAILLFPAFTQLFPSSFKSAAVSFISSVFYAVSDEIHQAFVPGRSCEFRDILIDSCGALTGLIFLFLLRQLYLNFCKKRGL